MADLYLTPAERYTAALGGFYYGDLPEPGTVYTQLIKDILDGSTPDKVPKNILARFIYSLYISDLDDPYPRYELAKLLYWKLHNITPTKSGSILTVTIDGKEDYMTINTDLSRLWYKVLFGSKTDIVTEFPYIFNTMQNKLSDWELFGNAETSGTPTPDNPIMPQGTGERTGNLWNAIRYSYTSLSDSSVWVYSSSLTGSVYRVPCMPNTKYTLYLAENVSISIWRICEVSTDAVPNASSTSVPTTGAYATAVPASKLATFTTSASAKYILFQTNESAYDSVLPAIMLIEGTSKIPYEPYGYKIPISSANTTTPVYLGEVETTRKIKKLVLTGEEETNFYRKNTTSADDNSLYYIRFAMLQSVPLNGSPLYCTHLQNLNYTPSEEVGINVSTTYNVVYFNLGLDVMNAQTSGNTVAGLKEYLSAQYAVGTPVTIWYVLATEETAIVNEPLMKIGDYADSMSRAQTGIDIPTVIGQNTLDVLTTVKPSSMRIEYTSADENRSRSKRISLLKSPLKKGLIK